MHVVGSIDTLGVGPCVLILPCLYLFLGHGNELKAVDICLGILKVHSLCNDDRLIGHVSALPEQTLKRELSSVCRSDSHKGFVSTQLYVEGRRADKVDVYLIPTLESRGISDINRVSADRGQHLSLTDLTDVRNYTPFVLHAVRRESVLLIHSVSDVQNYLCFSCVFTAHFFFSFIFCILLFSLSPS